MRGIKVILFDIDGTLLDVREFILQATEYALKKLGYSVPERQTMAMHVGEPFAEYYFALTGSREHIDRLIDIHREFQYQNFHLAKPFPGVLETLSSLKKKGYRLAAVTSRSKKTSHQTLKDSGIFDFFETVISVEDTENLKPHPEPLLKALADMGELPQRAVMIGDSHLDIEAGKAAGTKTIRVTYGFHKEKLNDPEPDYLIYDIKDLLDLL